MTNTQEHDEPDDDLSTVGEIIGVFLAANVVSLILFASLKVSMIVLIIGTLLLATFLTWWRPTRKIISHVTDVTSWWPGL